MSLAFPNRLLLETLAFEAQSRSGLKSRPLAEVFVKMPAKSDYMRCSVASASITIATRILLSDRVFCAAAFTH
jgi:hypothetical protein